MRQQRLRFETAPQDRAAWIENADLDLGVGRRRTSVRNVRLLLLALLRIAAGGPLRASMERLGEWMGQASRSTARRAVRDAEELGVLVRRERDAGPQGADAWEIDFEALIRRTPGGAYLAALDRPAPPLPAPSQTGTAPFQSDRATTAPLFFLDLDIKTPLPPKPEPEAAASAARSEGQAPEPKTSEPQALERKTLEPATAPTPPVPADAGAGSPETDHAETAPAEAEPDEAWPREKVRKFEAKLRGLGMRAAGTALARAKARGDSFGRVLGHWMDWDISLALGVRYASPIGALFSWIAEGTPPPTDRPPAFARQVAEPPPPPRRARRCRDDRRGDAAPVGALLTGALTRFAGEG